jgi:hypothetical protein
VPGPVPVCVLFSNPPADVKFLAATPLLCEGSALPLSQSPGSAASSGRRRSVLRVAHRRIAGGQPRCVLARPGLGCRRHADAQQLSPGWGPQHPGGQDCLRAGGHRLGAGVRRYPGMSGSRRADSPPGRPAIPAKAPQIRTITHERATGRRDAVSVASSMRRRSH